MTTNLKVTNYKEVFFPFPTLTPIDGYPTYASIAELRKQVLANLGSVPTALGGGVHGHVGLGVTSTAYALISTTPYVRPINPGPFTPTTNVGQYDKEKDEHKENTNAFIEVNLVEKVFDILNTNGYTPTLHILDNECSTDMKKSFTKNNVTFQRVPPDVHRRNAAERAIQTWKNHFIAGLASTDPSFPLNAWDHLLPQCNLTLNLLRSSRRQPRLSAHTCFFGNFDFNATPLAVPGTRVLIHEPPSRRLTFAPHGLEGFYIGPSMEHYRCYKVFVPSTQSTRDVLTLEWFPSSIPYPRVGQNEYLQQTADDLLTLLEGQSPTTYPTLNFGSPTRNAYSDLAKLLKRAATHPTLHPDITTDPSTSPTTRPEWWPPTPTTRPTPPHMLTPSSPIVPETARCRGADTSQSPPQPPTTPPQPSYARCRPPSPPPPTRLFHSPAPPTTVLPSPPPSAPRVPPKPQQPSPPRPAPRVPPITNKPPVDPTPAPRRYPLRKRIPTNRYRISYYSISR